MAWSKLELDLSWPCSLTRKRCDERGSDREKGDLEEEEEDRGEDTAAIGKSEFFSNFELRQQ